MRHELRTALHQVQSTSSSRSLAGNNYDSRDYGASAPNQNSYHCACRSPFRRRKERRDLTPPSPRTRTRTEATLTRTPTAPAVRLLAAVRRAPEPAKEGAQQLTSLPPDAQTTTQWRRIRAVQELGLEWMVSERERGQGRQVRWTAGEFEGQPRVRGADGVGAGSRSPSLLSLQVLTRALVNSASDSGWIDGATSHSASERVAPCDPAASSRPSGYRGTISSSAPRRVSGCFITCSG